MKIKRLFASLILGLGMALAFLWLLTAGSMILVYAGTYTVTNTNASGPGSLRQAIIDANGNTGHDTIDFGIIGTIVLTDALPAIGDDLTISGPGAEQLAISGASTYRVFSITTGTSVTITGVTVRDGKAVNSSGGGIWSAGNLHLNSARIVSNTATGFEPFGAGGGLFVWDGSATLSGTQVLSNTSSSYGGGVHIESGIATLNGTRVVSNSASQGGGVSIASGSATLVETQVISNWASTNGGGVYVSWHSATLNVDGGEINSNSSSGSGGGLLVSQGSATLNGTQVISNSASYEGGGVFVWDGSATLIGTQVVGNWAASGGGVFVRNSSATLNVSGGRIDGNSVSSSGGGVTVLEGSAILSGTQVVGNLASLGGGGLRVDSGSATLNGTRVVSNSTYGGGGGVNVFQGSVTLVGTQVVDNWAFDNGGGVSVGAGSATLSETQVISNSSASYGGGVSVNSGSATLNGTQVVGNSAASGGGVHVSWRSATLNVDGGRIDSNSASSYGGGVFIEEGNATLIETQVFGNWAYRGGGAYVQNSHATLNVSGGRIDSNSVSSIGGGVIVFEGSAMLSRTQVIGNWAYSGGALYLASSGTITATDGCIVFNSDVAVNRVGGTLTATDNWWGAADGPGGAGPGSGDTVSEGVDYANFKTVVPPSCSSQLPGYDSNPAPGSSINVGMASVGSTVSAALTINETGGATLVVTPALSGVDAADFGVVPSTLTIVDGGAAQDLTISCTPSFTGTLAGTLVRTLAATLTVVHNAPDSPAVYSLSCIGGALRYVYLPLTLRNN